MDNKKTSEERVPFSGILRVIRSEAERRRGERGALLSDVVVFAVALFFARRHIAFGTYPLATALVAVLPSRVWIALIGAVVGAVSLGKSGIIHAIILVVIVFLRTIISGNAKGADGEEAPLFSEPTVMRAAAATIGSFVGAAYEILLSGFSFPSILFGVFGVLLTVVFCFLYSGIFSVNFSVEEFLYGRKNILCDAEKQKDKYALLLFQGSFLVFSFLISYSLVGYDFFGISPSYIVSVILTLFVAKRFGAARAMTVGFVSALGLSSVVAVAFALCGAVAGLLFRVSAGYALLGGGVLVSLWSAYAGGINGFLSVFPEYSLTAILFMPILRHLPSEEAPEKSESIERSASDMVGAMATSYRSRVELCSKLEASLFSAAAAIRNYGEGDGRGDYDTYRSIVSQISERSGLTPCEENIDIIATKLYKRMKLTADDATLLGADEEIISAISASGADYELSCYEKRRVEALAKEYELISKMINEAALAEERERGVDTLLTERAKEIFSSHGFPDGAVRVFGERRKHIIAAGEDADGSIITSAELKSALESALGIKLGTPEYYRKDNMVLLECSVAASMQISYATASAPKEHGEISGDSSVFFETSDTFFALISDGMGSGEIAKKTSSFVTEFLSRVLTPYSSDTTVMSALNHIIRHRTEECSATVDLFRFDRLTGEAIFVKSGAAPSYVKRGDSLFRIRSQSAPIGLMKSVDAERIRVEVKSGDYIVMVSDGVSATPEDAPWLLEFLNKPTATTPQDYAEAILAASMKHSRSRDDMTVSVVKITAV